MMENGIIIALLAVIIAVAVARFGKHFRGGGCCGSGSKTIRDKKILTQPVTGETTLNVEGMHCENCVIRIENALNRQDGVLAKGNLKKKTIRIQYTHPVEEETLRETIENLGYKVK